MKRLKVLASSMLVGSMVILGATGAFAKTTNNATTTIKSKSGKSTIVSTQFNPPVEESFQTVTKANTIKPMYVPYTGDEYEYSSKTLYKAKSWGTVITNSSSTVDQVSRTVSRSKFAGGTIGLSTNVSVNWPLIQNKISVTAEGQWNKTTTVSVTYTWNIPAHSKTTINTGSLAVATVGNVVHYSNGRVTSSQYVDCKYSYDDYADKTSVAY